MFSQRFASHLLVLLVLSGQNLQREWKGGGGLSDQLTSTFPLDISIHTPLHWNQGQLICNWLLHMPGKNNILPRTITFLWKKRSQKYWAFQLRIPHIDLEIVHSVSKSTCYFCHPLKRMTRSHRQTHPTISSFITARRNLFVSTFVTQSWKKARQLQHVSVGDRTTEEDQSVTSSGDCFCGKFFNFQRGLHNVCSERTASHF